MTLQDLFKLIRRDWKLVAALPVVLAVLCALVMLVMPAEYQAKANISVSGEAAAIGGIAEDVAASKATDGVSVSATTDASKKRITIAASGRDAAECVRVANEVAQSVVDDAAKTYEKIVCQVGDGVSAKDISPSIPKYSLAAFVAGLFLAVCALVGRDMLVRPIKGVRGAEGASGLKALGSVSLSGDALALRKLVANIGFASKGANTLCLVPAGASVSADALCGRLRSAMRELGLPARSIGASSKESVLSQLGSVQPPDFALVSAKPLSATEDGIYFSHAAGMTLLVVQEWASSCDDVEQAVRELSLASANVVGMVFVREPDGARGGKSLLSEVAGKTPFLRMRGSDGASSRKNRE